MKPVNVESYPLKQTVEQQLRYRLVDEVWPWVIPVATVAFIILMVNMPNSLAYATIWLVAWSNDCEERSNLPHYADLALPSPKKEPEARGGRGTLDLTLAHKKKN
jgi:hypothetical protein